MRKIREQDPLKQGLKQPKTSCFCMRIPKIREQDPLKQGLKLETGFSIAIFGMSFVSKIH